MAISGLSGSSGLNFNTINDTLYQGIRSQETQLRSTLSTLGTNADGTVNQADLLAMQQQVQQWTMMIDIQSTITKQVADSLKGVIQKSS
ncbi:type III secretion protein [Bordetella genomosp. 5]|uniref:Type III secretion protein n=1 Tax=Bordetella genomosp. 5 TaxID=1395608 RepID=A0A261TAQ1_9BORD|nr:EscF/YscF/HrpA family type III secretion system needle major subunit [Bordetella genomosp. 5]OZI39921.1 type III secretion protein [Bordetella genomosp. 5]OZI46679.1 type III secretion protein [Bordetella genomosp. 5]